MKDSGTCSVCNCTEQRGCVGGCFWVTPSLCSRCAIKQLEAAHMNAGPLHEVVNAWRANGYSPGDDAGMAPVMVPLVVLHNAMSALSAWVMLVEQQALVTPAGREKDVEAAAVLSHHVITYYDQLAAGAAVPSFDEMDRQMGVVEQVPQTPVPRLWRPGDPDV